MVAPVRCATPGTEVVCAMYPLDSPRSTIQSASTPPPSPPMARIAILIGCIRFMRSSEGVAFAGARGAALQVADDGAADALAQAVPAARVGDDLRLVEGRAQHRGVRDLAAQAAADAGVEHSRDWVGTQRVGVGLDRQRRTAGEADAGVVAGAGVRVD